MRFRIYQEGRFSETRRDYSAPGHGDGKGTSPSIVELYAQTYAEEWGKDRQVYDPMNVIVEPADEPARGLAGWTASDERGPFRRFMVRARVEVEWTAKEVLTFNPYSPSYIDPWKTSP